MTFHFNCSKFSISWRSVGMTANVCIDAIVKCLQTNTNESINQFKNENFKLTKLVPLAHERTAQTGQADALYSRFLSVYSFITNCKTSPGNCICVAYCNI